jgi:hypothetical protein
VRPKAIAHHSAAPPSLPAASKRVRVLIHECEPHLRALERAQESIEKASARAEGGSGRAAKSLFAAHDQFLQAKYDVWQRLGRLDAERIGGALSPAEGALVQVALARLGACIGAVRGLLY